MLNNILIVLFICYNHVMCEYLDLREGLNCSKNLERGICINVHNCLKAKTDIPAKVDVPICSYEGKTPIVCCTDCYTFNFYDVRDEVINPNVGELWNDKSRAENKFNEYLDKVDYPCKRYLNTTYSWSYNPWAKCYYRDETQTDSSEGIDYPRDPELIHTVLLGYGEELETAQWLCGGSIISENFILTSANCTDSILHGPVKFVALGPLNGTGEPMRTYLVKRIIPYPLYRPSSKYHDIALLETATEIQFNEQVAPVAVVTSNTASPRRAVAWSLLGHGKPLIETLKSTSVTTLNYYDEPLLCSLLFPPQPVMEEGYNDTIQFCCSEEERIDVCEGDSGGSIITKDRLNCANSIFGVTSLGRVCGTAGTGVLFTRVNYYRAWIENIVWPGENYSYANQRRNKNKKKN